MMNTSPLMSICTFSIPLVSVVDTTKLRSIRSRMILLFSKTSNASRFGRSKDCPSMSTKNSFPFWSETVRISSNVPSNKGINEINKLKTVLGLMVAEKLVTWNTSEVEISPHCARIGSSPVFRSPIECESDDPWSTLLHAKLRLQLPGYLDSRTAWSAADYA